MGKSPNEFWSPLPGSNQRPTDYKSVALPAELRRLECRETKVLICNSKTKGGIPLRHSLSSLGFIYLRSLNFFLCSS